MDLNPFIAHDFFQPQPKRDSPPAAFILRMIAHDWGDEYLLKIVKHLRQAAGPGTYLLIQDNVLLYACPGEIYPEGVQLPAETIPPSPLLRNWGKSVPYLADILVSQVIIEILTTLTQYLVKVLSNLNGQERTLLQFHHILQKGGWNLREMRRAENIGLHLPLLIATPHIGVANAFI